MWLLPREEASVPLMVLRDKETRGSDTSIGDGWDIVMFEGFPSVS